MNKFGEAEGYEYLLDHISQPDLSIESLSEALNLFVKPHSMYHR